MAWIDSLEEPDLQPWETPHCHWQKVLGLLQRARLVWPKEQRMERQQAEHQRYSGTHPGIDDCKERSRAKLEISERWLIPSDVAEQHRHQAVQASHKGEHSSSPSGTGKVCIGTRWNQQAHHRVVGAPQMS